jgi:sugar-specific transcriptional regulator TrmB
MKQKTLLEKIGFTEKESQVYLSLVKLGPSSATDIVKKAKLHRPEVYKALPVLIEKQLVSIVPKGKSKLYVAASPDKLEKVFKDIQDAFFSEIEDLHREYDEQGKRPVVTFSEGKEAITNVYSDMVHGLKKGETYFRYSSNSNLTNSKSLVPKEYRKVRDAKQLERLVITNEPTKKGHSLSLGRSIKSIPQTYDLFEYGISLLIYHNKVVIIDYNSKSTITIENEKFAEFQKKIFKLLFSKL